MAVSGCLMRSTECEFDVDHITAAVNKTFYEFEEDIKSVAVVMLSVARCYFSLRVEEDVKLVAVVMLSVARCYFSPVSYTHLTLPTKRIV